MADMITKKTILILIDSVGIFVSPRQSRLSFTFVQPHMPGPDRKRVFRLRNFDYSQSGSYFVTLKANHRRHNFGRIVDGRLLPSSIGRIVEEDWLAIPSHYSTVTLDVHCLMPNHLHGIITIHGKDRCLKSENVPRKFGPPVRGSLSSIVGAFKSGVTWKARRAGLWGNGPLWHPRFHDSVIWSDLGLYRVRRYIELNPLLWVYKRRRGRRTPDVADELAKGLKELGVDGRSAYEVLTSKKVQELLVRD